MPATAATKLPEQFGRYRITRLIGEGGMGAVYLARDTQLDRDVALKIPQFRDADSSGLLERFYQEARAAATVQHPNICPIFDVGEIDNIHYLTMAFIDGVPLEKWAVGEKAITIRQLAVLVRKIASAMHEAHKKGVIHRDLKPANIMIDRRGEPIVMDFGLARRIQAGDQRLTQSGAIMGSPAYMAPEQVKGDQSAIGPASDIYALGVILYELLTHRLPFVGEDNLAMLAQVLLDEPPAPSSFRPDLEANLEAICLKAMAKKSGDRYASMGDLAAALQDYLRGSPKQPEPKTQAAAATLPPSNSKTDPLGIRVSQMGGLKSMAKLQGQLSPGRKIDSTPSKRRRKQLQKRGKPIWIWIAGACTALVVFGIVAVMVFSKSDDRKKSTTESDTAVAKIGPQANSTTKAAPVETSPAPAKNPRTEPNNPRPQADIPPGMIQSNFGMDLVFVPKGRAWLGGGKDKPGTEVTINYDFYLGRYEVTQGEWERLTESNPSYFSRKGLRSQDVAGLSDADVKRLPVDRVTWKGCQEFVAMLNRRFPQNGWIYRLPTVLEWEYACRGGPMADRSEGRFDFYGGVPKNECSDKDGNFLASNLKRTAPVGSYRPNRLGLHDMQGNVWEWCDDQRLTPNRMLCASLGGGFKDPAERGTPTSRGDADPLWTDETRGMRVARVPIGQAGSQVTESMGRSNGAGAGPEAAAAARKKLDDFIESMRDKIGCTAAVLAIGRTDGPAYVQAYGWIDGDRKIPATIETMFPVDHAGIIFANASVRQLAANKQLDLSQSCLKFLNIKPRGKVIDERIWSITIQNVLDAKAGWNDKAIEVSRALARTQKANRPFVETVLTVLATGNLDDTPGTKDKGSSLNREILEDICEKASGIPPLDYYRTKLFGRQFSGVAMSGGPSVRPGMVLNAPDHAFCASAPAVLEFMLRFTWNGTPNPKGFAADYTWEAGTFAGYFIWRGDGVFAVMLFNGSREGARGGIHKRLNDLIDSTITSLR